MLEYSVFSIPILCLSHEVWSQPGSIAEVKNITGQADSYILYQVEVLYQTLYIHPCTCRVY